MKSNTHWPAIGDRNISLLKDLSKKDESIAFEIFHTHTNRGKYGKEMLGHKTHGERASHPTSKKINYYIIIKHDRKHEYFDFVGYNGQTDGPARR